jgi:hypothetical protein
VFPEISALQPYEAGLKPLFKWLNTAEKHKGAAIKGAKANNCSPDAPKAVPIQFSSSRAKTPQNAGAIVATESAAHQSPQYTDLSQNKISTIKVNVNLVLVRVVVRDSQGRTLGTLRQQDFQLRDNGKAQSITRFSLEEPGAGTERCGLEASARGRGSSSVFNTADSAGGDLHNFGTNFPGLHERPYQTSRDFVPHPAASGCQRCKQRLP